VGGSAQPQYHLSSARRLFGSFQPAVGGCCFLGRVSDGILVPAWKSRPDLMIIFGMVFVLVGQYMIWGAVLLRGVEEETNLLRRHE
jgi:hypothetical protein